MYEMKLLYKSASLDVTVWEDDTVGSVANVWSAYRRKGHATGLMKRLIKIADQMQLDLILLVAAYDVKNGPTNDQLTEFYKRFGFKKTDPDVMERKAK